ncbi:hypothetical protein HK405_010419 [Cladochytrium tenue]|nr:hypothetical protein HK405_010419 [Cladochytrium tenue]
MTDTDDAGVAANTTAINNENDGADGAAAAAAGFLPVVVRLEQLVTSMSAAPTGKNVVLAAYVTSSE